MIQNEGTVDRALRVIVGLGLIMPTIAGLIGPWGWIGVIPFATGLAGWCPMYRALGINTCSLKDRTS